MRRTRAYLGLGGNVGDVPANLAAAVAAIAALPDVRLAGVSDLYRTRPVGLAGQPDFLNAVVAADVPTGAAPEIGALALLFALKSLERAFGRRKRVRWGPRELDLDILIFGRHRIRVERPTDGRSANPERADVQWLEVPHPLARERLFVLAPLSDLARWLSPPGWRETVDSARRRREAVEGEGAVVLAGRWDAAARRWRSTTQ